jgi:APA family basic amino acid/polyamine antiporter
MTLFTRKGLAELQEDAGSGSLRRVLGARDLITLGIGAIIGSGVYVLTGPIAAQYAGPAIVISIMLAGLACAFAGLCYAELASMIPVSGSAYTYAYATLGEIFAWIIGWDLILEYTLGAAITAVGFSSYVLSLLHNLGIAIPANGNINWIAPIGVLAATALVAIGIRESAIANATIVLIKVAVLMLFIGFGAAYVRPANWSPFIPDNTGPYGSFGWSGILRGAAVCFFAFIGFDAVSTAAQESRNPQRDMPIGILGSLGICTVLYVLVALVLTGLVPYHNLNVADPMSVGIDATGLHWLRPFVKLGAAAGLWSVMLVLLYAQPRVLYVMSRDGLLPRAFGRVHPRFATPYVPTIATGCAVALLSAIVPIRELGELVSIGTLLAFVIVCAGVLVLRYTEPDIPRPFRTPGAPLIPVLGAMACFYLMSQLPLITWGRLLIWFGIGLGVYFFSGRARAARLREDRLSARR